MKNNQILGIWGSPSSGKTVTSIKIAKALSVKKKNVIIVHTDIYAPAIMTVLPAIDTEEKSLGKLLAEPELTQEKILKNLITLKHNEYISFLGYGNGENKYTYAEYTKEKVIDLIILLRHLSDYIILDCSSIITEDLLTVTALEMADRVLRLSTCNLKGVSYMRSYLPLLADSKFNLDKHIRVLVNTNDSPLKSEITESLSGINLYIPYTKQLSDQFINCELLEELGAKAAKPYQEAIHKILKGVFDE